MSKVVTVSSKVKMVSPTRVLVRSYLAEGFKNKLQELNLAFTLGDTKSIYTLSFGVKEFLVTAPNHTTAQLDKLLSTINDEYLNSFKSQEETSLVNG